MGMKFFRKAGSVLLASALLMGSAAVVMPQMTDIAVEAQAVSDFEYIKANAGSIDTNKWYPDTLKNTEWSYCKFTLNHNGVISINMKHELVNDGFFYCKSELYDEKGNFIVATNYPNKSVESSCENIGLGAGTYYLKFQNNLVGKTINYEVSVNVKYPTENWETEFNDTDKTAQKIKNNTKYIGYSSYYSLKLADYDAYAFSVKDYNNIKLIFDHDIDSQSSLEWKINIYKKSDTKNPIYSYSISAKDANTFTKTIKFAKGDYYLVVNSVVSAGLKYSFRLDEIKTPLSLDKTSMTLGKGETTKLTASGATGIYKWRTSNSKVLTVDQKGNVKAVGIGTAWITARSSDGKEKSCKITAKAAPSKVSLSNGVLTIGVGEKRSLTASVNDGSGCATRTFRTSNPGVVKMTRTNWQGDFVGVKPGVAYVTVRTYNGKEATCKVTVKAAPTSVTISKKTLTMKVGQTASLSAWVNNNAGCATRTFRTSNPSVVKMTRTNWTGSFKAMKPGVAYVTVRTYNGKESSCKVTVTK